MPDDPTIPNELLRGFLVSTQHEAAKRQNYEIQHLVHLDMQLTLGAVLLDSATNKRFFGRFDSEKQQWSMEDSYELSILADSLLKWLSRITGALALLSKPNRGSNEQ